MTHYYAMVDKIFSANICSWIVKPDLSKGFVNWNKDCFDVVIANMWDGPLTSDRKNNDQILGASSPDKFAVASGPRQGCGFSPRLFDTALEDVPLGWRKSVHEQRANLQDRCSK